MDKLTDRIVEESLKAQDPQQAKEFEGDATHVRQAYRQQPQPFINDSFVRWYSTEPCVADR